MIVSKLWLALFIAITLTALMLSVSIGAATAQEDRVGSGNTAPAQASPQGPTDPVELAAFLDELIGKQMSERDIAGAAVSVVKDGELLLSRGFGYADLEHGIPVDAEQTIFRIGSVGKVFTWTAVMQLVEQGKLDLEADVNSYLDFRIPDTYREPIRVKHLLTHTSGFEDRLLGSVVADAKDFMPVPELLVSQMPVRVRPPGELAGYANYNAVLAGYIVSRVSGQPYDRYIQEQILDPLGMAHSTAYSPLPPSLRPFASVGYTYKDEAFQAFPDYTSQPGVMPSGGHYSSVSDMARFMIAHLQGAGSSASSITEARILKESTVQQMQTTLYTPDQRLRGTAYGWFDLSENGQRTLGHEGYLPPMHSALLLLPDQKLGVFVVYNSAGGGEPTLQHAGFQRAFFDHYFPAQTVAPPPPSADFAARAGRFVGAYRLSSSPATTLIKIVELFGAYRAEVSNPADGTLLFKLQGLESRFVEVEPLYFRQVDGPFSALFQEDDRGRITRMFTDLMPQYATVKLDWYETVEFNLALALACTLLFLSAIPITLISLIRKRRPSNEPKPDPYGVRTASWIVLGVSLLNLLFVAGVWGVMQWGMTSELHPVSLLTKAVLGLGVLAAVLALAALFYTALAWARGYWGIATRAYYTLVSIAAAAFVWFLNYWNLLGWRY
jgi:CubicO group peptidase (beta-lactamase class C family)